MNCNILWAKNNMSFRLTNRSGVAGILLLFIILLVLLGVIALGDFGYIAYQKQQNVYPTATPVPNQTQTPVTARGNFSKDKYSVEIIMKFILEGGSVTGSFSGACEGNISGSYDGKDGGVISGQAVGSCDPLVVPVPASATYTGRVDRAQRLVNITAEGSAAGFSGSGSISLSY